MRSFLAFGVILAACSNDSFEGGDAGDASSNNDVTVGPDAATVDVGPDALDTSTFEQNVVLWFDAADAVAANTVVSQWPAHKNGTIQTTILAPPTTTSSCPVGGVIRTDNSLNGKPTVSFCAGLLSVADSVALQLGTSTFTIEAVARMTNASQGGILLTKEKPGDSTLVQLTFWGRDTQGDVDGTISASETATYKDITDVNFALLGFVRSHDVSDKIVIRVNGTASAATGISASDDVSSSGNPYGIGGYWFDTSGLYHNTFNGDLAEIIVLRDGSDATIGLVEAYLNAKYALK